MRLRGIFDDRIIDGILNGEKPAGYVFGLTAEQGKRLKSQRFRFDIGKCQAFGSSLPIVVIARKGMAQDILRDISEIFSDLDFADSLNDIINQTKKMSIFQAVFYLLGHGNYVKGPEIAACVGLLFGYPSCCVRYFIKTRYFGFPHSDKKEAKHADVYILCEKCRKKHKKLKIKSR